jgi:hypothetical protein
VAIEKERGAWEVGRCRPGQAELVSKTKTKNSNDFTSSEGKNSNDLIGTEARCTAKWRRGEVASLQERSTL